MEEIKQLVNSPSFWFASVVIGFIISLLAGFTKDFTEKLWVKFSKKRRQKRECHERDIEVKVEKVKTNPSLLHTYQQDILYQKVRQILYYLVSYFCMFLGLHNFANQNVSVAIIFGILSVSTVAIPVQVITRNLNKLRTIVAKVIESDEHFRG